MYLLSAPPSVPSPSTVKEHALCSNRGACDLYLGTCTCYATPAPGFSGVACSSVYVAPAAQFSALDPILDVIGNEDVVRAQGLQTTPSLQVWL